MSSIETLRSFVESWECDENDHLNVQFYFGLFEDATAHYYALSGIEGGARPAALTRHVRYHSEMRSGQLIRIDTHAARGHNDLHWHLVHRLSEPATGRLAATALETYDRRAPVPQLLEVDAEARPRSLASEPSDLKALALRKGPMTHRGRFLPSEIDPAGHPFHRAAVARFSKAAGHFWEAFGVNQPWLAENRFGRVALEMKVTLAEPVSDALIEVRSGPLAIGNKTVSFFHLITAADSGTLIAAGEVTGVLFDQQARRAMPLPDEIRARLESALSRQGSEI